MTVWWMIRMMDLPWQSTNKRSLETVTSPIITGLLEMATGLGACRARADVRQRAEPRRGDFGGQALQKPSTAGQRIYHITQANQAAILPSIHHHPDTMAEIQNALNAGKEVITHTDAVSVPGWTGAGYIITDPVTGDGAYKISGGGNGSFIAGILLGSAIFIFLSALFVPALAALASTTRNPDSVDGRHSIR
jgi:hypothetical protein